MERADARPVTRSRRSMLGDILEKENFRTPSSSPNKKRSSISPKVDSVPEEMETLKSTKLSKEMDEKVIASPARVTRGRRSISINEVPPQSPSRNLRKRTVSPESKPTPRKKLSPKMETLGPQEDKNGSNVEMTPIKKNSRLAISSLATVDSPKPRKARLSISESSGTADTHNLRRSRRLSTELNVLQEDPIREGQIEDAIPIVKTRRGKRMSVLPTQPSVPEEMEVDDDKIRNVDELNNSTKSDFISRVDSIEKKSPKKVEEDVEFEDNLNLSKRRTPQRGNVSLNKSKKHDRSLTEIDEEKELNTSKRRTLTPPSNASLNKSKNDTSIISANDSVNEGDKEVNKSKRRTLTPQRINESLNKSKNDTSLIGVVDSVNEEDKDANNSKRRTLTPQRANTSLNKSKKDTTLSSADDLINEEDKETNKSKRRTLTPQRGNTSLNKSKSSNTSINNSKDFVNEEDVELNKSKRRTLTPQRANVSLNKSNKNNESLNDASDDVNENVETNKSKRRTATPQRSNTSLNKSKINTSLISADNLVNEEDKEVNESKNKTVTPKRANVSVNKSKNDTSLVNEEVDLGNEEANKSKRRTLTPQHVNTSLNKSKTSNMSINIDDNIVNEEDKDVNKSKRRTLTPQRVNESLNKSKMDKSISKKEDESETIINADDNVLNRSSLTPKRANLSLNKSKSNKSINLEENNLVSMNETSPAKDGTSQESNTSSNSVASHEQNANQNDIRSPISKFATSKSETNDEDIYFVIDNKGDSPKKNVSKHDRSNGSNSSRTTAKDIFMNESSEKIMNEEISADENKMARGVSLKNLSTSTPVVKNSKVSKSECSKNSLNKSIGSETVTVGSETVTAGSEDDYDYESSKEDDSDNLIDSIAVEAESDYQSGDSLDEMEKMEIEDNEIIERGESLHSDSTEEGSDDDSYEKDSFLCSSEEEEMVLSGTGDDLSSGEELSQSQSSKIKHNKKQEKKQKNASREMYNARHSLDKSDSNASPKKKYKSIKSPEPDSDNSAENDEKEISNKGLNLSNKDALKLALADDDEDDDIESSDGEDLKHVTKLYNEELERLTNICVNTDSDTSEGAELKNSDKTDSFSSKIKQIETLNTSNKSDKGRRNSDVRASPKISPKKNVVEDLPVSKNLKRLSKANLNRSDVVSTSSVKHSDSKKYSNSFSSTKDNTSAGTDAVQESISEMNRLFNINSSLSKVFKTLLNDVDILKSTVNENIVNQSAVNYSNTNISKSNESNLIESEVQETKKRKLSSSNDSFGVDAANKIQCATVASDDVPTSLVLSEKKKSTEISDAIEMLDILKSDKTVADKKKMPRNRISKMKVDNLDRSEIVSGFKVKPAKTKSVGKIVSTSEFDVEELECGPIGCTNTAGNFTVSNKSKRRAIGQTPSETINSTTLFNVVSLKKNLKQATQVDEKFKAGFVNFKQEAMYGKSIKRESSADLMKKQKKLNAYRRTPY